MDMDMISPPTLRKISALLTAAAENTKMPSGEPLAVITIAAAQEIATATKVTLGDVYRLALAAGICPLSYLRNLGVLSIAEQMLLANSHIAIIGAGGLGGSSLTILSRLGIGTITIIDGDEFAESNLNRQLLCTKTTLGKSKAEVAADTAAKINPAVAVIPQAFTITEENAEALLTGTDLVIDALDNITARRVTAAAAQKMGIPFLHGAAAGFVGQLAIVQEGVKIEDIYPEGISISATSVLPFTPLFVASLQAAAALKILLGKESGLSGVLTHIDLQGERCKRLHYHAT